MYVCMPADPDSIRHSQRIVTAELFLRHCSPEQIVHARQTVADLAGPFCRDAEVVHYHLTVQRHHSTPGHFSVAIGANGRFVRGEIPLPRPGAEAPSTRT